MRVENMNSPNGNPVPNQFIIYGNDETYFQSYSSVIAKVKKGKTYLDENKWNYSVTTGKYRNLFLGESRKETEQKIKNGTYKLVNLN